MSIRLRLTILYSSILGVTLIAFAFFVYALLQRNLTREIDASLRTSSATTLRFLGIGRSEEPGRATRPGVGRIIALRSGTLPTLPGLPASDTYLQVVDSSGAVLARSGNLISADLTLPPPHPGVRNRSYEAVTVSGQDVRLLIDPIQLEPAASGASAVAFLEVARPLAEVQRTLGHLWVILVLGVLGALLLAGGAGWFLSRTALRPIVRLTRDAHEIGEAQDFSRRVAYVGPGDEVGRLASTFNEMLGRLQAAYGRIQSALEAQRRFVADASHELRTPLTTIRGNVELLALENQGESSDRREALEDIASEAERMSRLVTDLLALARADAGLHVQRGAVELRPLVEEVRRQMRRSPEGIRLELGDLPDVRIYGSADHLKQLLLILLDNARKYSPPDGVVRLWGEQSGGRLQLSVADSGPGIPREEQGRIFDRFYRLDPSRHGEGAGLGLAIARWIATEHDGTLTVESSSGNGSTFSVVLPLTVEPATVPQRRQPAAVDV